MNTAPADAVPNALEEVKDEEPGDIHRQRVDQRMVGRRHQQDGETIRHGHATPRDSLGQTTGARFFEGMCFRHRGACFRCFRSEFK